MPSLIPGYEYDIFISYRQKDNKYDGWVTEFYNNLRKELEATFKEDISIYFDENPHDGILEAHQVDQTVSEKLKCIIFIPILSRTYCDPNCFAWKSEFIAFIKHAAHDQIGPQIKLKKGNIASRVLPIRIHELEPEDINLVERELGSQVRAVDFVFKAPGVNRPLRANEEHPKDNLEKTYYRDQVNKVANFISDIISSVKRNERKDPETIGRVIQTTSETEHHSPENQPGKIRWFWNEVLRRNVFRAAFTYILVSFILFQFIKLVAHYFPVHPSIFEMNAWILVAVFPVALILAWYFEVSPDGLIRTTTKQSEVNPYTDAQKKPLTNRSSTFILLLLLVAQFGFLNYLKDSEQPSQVNNEISIAVTRP